MDPSALVLPVVALSVAGLALLASGLAAAGLVARAVAAGRDRGPITIVVNPEEVVGVVEEAGGEGEGGDDAEPDWRGDRFPEN